MSKNGITLKDGKASMWWHDCGSSIEFLGVEISACHKCGRKIPAAAKEAKNESA